MTATCPETMLALHHHAALGSFPHSDSDHSGGKVAVQTSSSFSSLHSKWVEQSLAANTVVVQRVSSVRK